MLETSTAPADKRVATVFRHPPEPALLRIGVILFGRARRELLGALQSDRDFRIECVRPADSDWKKTIASSDAVIVVAMHAPMSAFAVAVASGLEAPIILLTGADGRRVWADARLCGAVLCTTAPLSSPDVTAIAAAIRQVPLIDAEAVDCTPRLDPIRLTITRGARCMRLTPTEFALLHALAKHEHAPRAEHIIESVWAHASTSASRRPLEYHVSQLRRKFVQLGIAASLITSRQRGYRLVEPIASLFRAIPSGTAFDEAARRARQTRTSTGSSSE